MARQSFSRYLPWLVTGPAALLVWPVSAWASAGFAVLFVLGWVDFKQTKQAVRRNYPLTGRLRYGLEYIRPELRQYFLEDDEEKLPFSRNQRAMVYARSKVPKRQARLWQHQGHVPRAIRVDHALSAAHRAGSGELQDHGGRTPMPAALCFVTAQHFRHELRGFVAQRDQGPEQGCSPGAVCARHRRGQHLEAPQRARRRSDLANCLGLLWLPHARRPF